MRRIPESEPLAIEMVAKLVAERRKKCADEVTRFWTAVRIQTRISFFWGW
jgi:hypothetical protein